MEHHPVNPIVKKLVKKNIILNPEFNKCEMQHQKPERK